MSFSNDRNDRTEDRGERGDKKGPDLQRSLAMRKQFFKRRKVCPFSGPTAVPIDYKDVRLLSRFVSEKGKIMPSRITGVSRQKQKELSQAIRRARFLALMPYVNL